MKRARRNLKKLRERAGVLNKRYIARCIAKYHEEHGLPKDKDRDWFWACDLLRQWKGDIVDRRYWELRHRKLRMTDKEFTYCWLDNFRYGYAGTGRIKDKLSHKIVMFWEWILSFMGVNE